MIGYSVVALPVFGSFANNRLEQGQEIISVRTQEYIRNTQILVNLARATGQLVLLCKRTATLAGYTSRVSELLEFFDNLNDESLSLQSNFSRREGLGRVTQGEYIKFENVSVVAPDGRVLIKDLSFEIHPRMNILIQGPNGSGKSALFRILCGLWPVQYGSLMKPPPPEIFYVSQRPYLPLGTFRDQIIYPHTASQMLESGVTDEDLERLLQSMHFLYLLDRPGRWDAVEDWEDLLSGDEKQRLAMARLFYWKPRFTILDECTSDVSPDVEQFIYDHARELDMTLITVSHKDSLRKYHDYLLSLDGEGNWDLRPMTELEEL